MESKHKQNKRLREYRKRTNNAATRKYEKTQKGFLMRCYRNMQSRVSGVQKLKNHLYHGKPLLDRETFYKWSLSNNAFHHLFGEWEKANYERRLTPSINRINPDDGYTLSNVEWITHSENSANTRRWINHNL